MASQLAEAKQHISDFLSVQLNLTAPALRLQSVWVGIVGTIGDAAVKLTSLEDLFGRSAIAALKLYSAAGALQAGANANAGNRAGNTTPIKGDFDADSIGNQIRLAKQGLAALLDLDASSKDDIGKYKFRTFTGRFTDDTSQLAGGQKDDDKPAKSDAYDRSIQSIKDQIAVLKLEADGAGKTSQAVEEMKVAHEANLAAMKAGITVTADMRAQWKQYGDTLADTTIKINQAKSVQSESFKGATMFMSPSDTAAANAARQIDPTNWQAHMGDQGPQMAAMNAQLDQAKGLADSFASSFALAMNSGKSATDALRSSISSLESSLVSLLAKAAVNNLFGSLLGGLGGTAGISGGGNFLKFSAMGNAFDGGNVIPFASGGVVDRTTIFPMANGAGVMGEAGPEAVMPLTRMSGGKLGVKTSGAMGGHTFHISTPVSVTVPPGSSPEDASKMAAAFGRQADDMITQKVHQVLIDNLRSGGALNP